MGRGLSVKTKDSDGMCAGEVWGRLQGAPRVSWGGRKVEVTSLGARKRGLGATVRRPQGELGWMELVGRCRCSKPRCAQARSVGPESGPQDEPGRMEGAVEVFGN